MMNNIPSWLPLLIAALATTLGCDSTRKAPEMTRATSRAPTAAAPTPPSPPTASATRASRLAPSVPSATAGMHDCSAKSSGASYEVGQEQKYKKLGDVPWENLKAGDTVRVHWRSEPYREKVLISTQGTQNAPIRVCGVPGPKGEKPVIDGENATTRKETVYPYTATQDRGLIVLSKDRSTRYGFKPSHIVIQGLELRNASQPHAFTDGQGKPRKYMRNAAAIFVERGEHIVIRDCAIHSSGNGVFVASGGEAAIMSRDILIEYSHIYGNSNVGSDREHNIYTEASGLVLQYNDFGPTREGSGGNNIKDRSAGTVVRYNRIEGGAHLLDLVEAQDSFELMRSEPDYYRTFVYGNLLHHRETGSSSMLHYGGDSGMTKTYRNGTLYFYHNTVVVEARQEKLWLVSLFRLETDQQKVVALNNILHRAGTTALSLMRREGIADLGKNWIVRDWKQARRDLAGTINGSGALLAGDKPGFVGNGSFELAPGSPCIDAGLPLPNEIPKEHAVTSNFKAQPRKTSGKAPDLGALEAK